MKTFRFIFPLALLVVIFNCQLNASIFANGINCSVEPNNCKMDTDGIAASKMVAPLADLNSLEIQGAIYFLKSKSDFTGLLGLREIADIKEITSEEVKLYLENAIGEIEKANQMYIELSTLMTERVYDPEIVERLKNLSYDEILKRDGLNTVVFKDVESYMREGNTKGLIASIPKRMQSIIDSLYVIKKTVCEGSLPDLKDLWKSNEYYSNLNLFGQYTAIIMAEVN